MSKLGKIAIAVLFPVIAIFFTIRLTYAINSQKQAITIISPLPQTSFLVSNTQPSPNNSQPEENGNLLKNELNILFLGLDGRKGDKSPRCDAIQLISFNFDQNKILITSIPRGTEVTTQVQNMGKQTNYFSNWCHYLGVDFATKMVEKITGIKPDYTVKLGFSQTLGILRSLNLPTTPVLQFLRNRSYGIGDWQRSRNQAQFIKDMMIGHFDEMTKLPNLLKYLVYKMVETEMPFEVASQLFDKISLSAILNNPDNIKLATIPNPSVKLKELHFEKSKYQNGGWQNDNDFLVLQNNLEIYLENLVERAQKEIERNNNSAAYQLIKTPFAQELWLQMEDEAKRNRLHFELLSLYVQTSPEKTNLSSLVLDFITEMETVGDKEYQERGEELLKSFI